MSICKQEFEGIVTIKLYDHGIMQYILGLSQRNQEEYWVRSLVEDHLPVI